ncbi:hypothetical protein HDU98_003638 [Podochytrium sp. JEL0797]|nr:hypothetical protein HDU98_003638 [Podochytrium sp. JEL0797]
MDNLQDQVDQFASSSVGQDAIQYLDSSAGTQQVDSAAQYVAGAVGEGGDSSMIDSAAEGYIHSLSQQGGNGNDASTADAAAGDAGGQAGLAGMAQQFLETPQGQQLEGQAAKEAESFF